MTRWKGRFGSLVLLAVLAVTGCADSTGSGGRLDQPSSLEIADEFMLKMQHIGAVSLTHEGEAFQETVACDRSGSIQVSGTITRDLDSEGTGALTFDLVQTPTGCEMSLTRGPTSIEGDPEIVTTGSMQVVQGTPGEFRFAFDGGINWARGGSSGRCSVNLSYILHYQNPSLTNVTGRMCGHSY
jgi:hypothetical protein